MIVTEWICSNFDLSLSRELRGELLQLPPTPLEAYRALLSQEAAAQVSSHITILLYYSSAIDV